MTTHFVIPDTQVKPFVSISHFRWIGKVISTLRPDKIIHLGDHWDMPSLSSYDKPGSKSMENRRYKSDVVAGNNALRYLRENIDSYPGWNPEYHMLRGNHEQRIARAVENDPRLEDSIGYSDLESPGWTVHDFLERVWIDGICYSHYFANPMTGRPLGGNIESRLSKLGHSFTMGHQQTLGVAIRYSAQTSQRGLVAGACYLHDEEYKGPQGNDHWRGCLLKRNVSEGSYDLTELSLDSLCRKYEGIALSDWLVSHPPEKLDKFDTA